MFVLVEFEKHFMQIYPQKSVILKENDKCIVRHKGTKYEATFLLMQDSKEYLEKYAETLYSSAETRNVEEKNDNNLSLDMSNFSIGSEFIDINFSCSSLKMSDQGSSLEMKISNIDSKQKDSLEMRDEQNIEEFKDISVPGGSWEMKEIITMHSSAFYMPNTSNQIDTLKEGYRKQVEEYEEPSNSDYSIDPTFQPNEGASEQIVPAEEENSLLNEIDESLNLLEETISTSSDVCDNENLVVPSYSDDQMDPTFQPNESDSEQSVSAEKENFSLNENNKSSNFLEETLSSSLDVCDNENLDVPISQKSGGQAKTYFCLFCHKKQSKFARHLESVHKNEDEVKKFTILPKGCKERMDLIGILRKRGNFIYNTKECFNEGSLIVSRRPNSTKVRKATDFKPCAKCKAFYSKNSLRVHFKACTGISSSKNRYSMVSGKKIEARLHCTANKMLREKLFPPFREDDIVRSIKYDELVIVYANKMCEKYRNERYCEMIRQRIRLIGRFLKTLKGINKNIQELSHIFDPAYCHDIINVINTLAGANDETGHFKNPTVASSLCTLLKYITKIFMNQCIIKHKDEERKNAKNFLLLFTQEIEIKVTRTVTESQVHMRRQKKVQLPSTNDIRKFYIYLRKHLAISYRRLKNKFSLMTWLSLSEFTLLSIQVFNRRRPGELERILIEDFKRFEGISTDGDEDMSEETQEAALRYVRFLIRGKLNRTVPVILDKKQVKCIELLLKYRSHAKINKKNNYVFAVPGISNTKYLRSCYLMRKHALLCGADQPERLRGTNLRKHIATTCIRLNLEEDEVKDLANFMGHNEKIYTNIYRQPVAARDILRVSKLLEMAQGEENEDEENRSDENGDEKEEPRMNRKQKRSTSPYGSVKRRRWTADETETALRKFEKHIERKKLPSFKEIQDIRLECEELSQRSCPQIKT